jgi:hypothetical protein
VRCHIFAAASSGQAFTTEDICDKHKDSKSETVKDVIAKFDAAISSQILATDMYFTRIWRISVKILNIE